MSSILEGCKKNSRVFVSHIFDDDRNPYDWSAVGSIDRRMSSRRICTGRVCFYGNVTIRISFNFDAESYNEKENGRWIRNVFDEALYCQDSHKLEETPESLIPRCKRFCRISRDCNGFDSFRISDLHPCSASITFGIVRNPLHSLTILLKSGIICSPSIPKSLLKFSEIPQDSVLFHHPQAAVFS